MIEKRSRSQWYRLEDPFEVGESSSATTARTTGHTLAHRVDYGFVDTVDASICAFESRAMTIIGRLLLPDRHGFTLRAGAKPWRPILELYRGMSMYYKGRGLEMRTD
ncbi:hypothetical protein Tco_1123385 [Tanacetum coccineum]|uniref:Uncharacterized protein n=1 Tax=Tanacetum coccineum TaxID=301880 RepID=A0ABQ5J4M4_9ASTR